MTKEQESFIRNVAQVVNAYRADYGISVASPIIAMAICESNWGKSGLAKFNNLFGMKCGSTWKGKSVNMKTKEEYTKGTLTDIRANFRVYDSFEEGIKGFFDFINTKRYSNLKGVTDRYKWVELIKADGYATSSTYVKTITRIIDDYHLAAFDDRVTELKSDMEIAREVLRGKWGNGLERVQRLTAAGYDAKAVQAIVNAMLK